MSKNKRVYQKDILSPGKCIENLYAKKDAAL
jgi:hypothetical protein